jgi:methylated-DNA-[protein]-cysteine S-methyltransferase
MVPCHRVLASGGGIGGFKGKIGKGKQEGENDAEKRALLRDEGVKFDGRGMVVGGPWGGFR